MSGNEIVLIYFPLFISQSPARFAHSRRVFTHDSNMSAPPLSFTYFFLTL